MMYPKIRELRIMHNLKQQFVAEHLGLSQPEYSRLETGLREARMDEIKQLADLYKVKVSIFTVDRLLAEPEEGMLRRVPAPAPPPPQYWVGLFESQQKLMTSMIQMQERTESLFDRVLHLINSQRA